MKSNTILIVVIALVVGFGSGFILRPVISPAPIAAVAASSGITGARSAQYFAAHVSEARRIAAGCQAGSVRGDECINAGQAITEVEGKERMKKFLGN